MTNDEINIAIAKLFGWVNIITEKDYPVGNYLDGRNLEKHPNGLHYPIPKYTESLDACREFEDTITVELQREIYAEILCFYADVSDQMLSLSWAFKVSTSKPEIRSKSFLRLREFYKVE